MCSVVCNVQCNVQCAVCSDLFTEHLSPKGHVVVLGEGSAGVQELGEEAQVELGESWNSTLTLIRFNLSTKSNATYCQCCH